MEDRFDELVEVVRQRDPVLASSMFKNKRNPLLQNTSSPNPALDVADQSTGTSTPEPQFMREYFQKVGVLKAAVNEASKHVERMRQLKQEAIRSTSPEEEKDVSHQLNHLLDATNVMLTKTKKALHVIKQENSDFAARKPDSSEARIRWNMHQALTRRFGAVLAEYQTVQTEYKQEVKLKVTRQVQLVYPEADQQQVEQMVEAGDMSSATALKTRMIGSHQGLKNAISDLQDKYRDVRRLEQSVAELHQMFVEIATLVEHQGELLDQIEFSVTQAKEFTEKAEVELITARKYQETAKKRMCWITVCLIILAIIIALPTIIATVR